MPSKAEKPLTYQGLTLSRTEWARRVGISPAALSERLRRGLSVEEALSAKKGDRPRGTRSYKDTASLRARIALLEALLTSHNIPLP